MPTLVIIYNKYVISVRICNKDCKTKPKVYAKYVRLSLLVTMPSWIAVVNHK